MVSTVDSQETGRRMDEQVSEKVWHIPGYEGSGPITMTLKLPEVTIRDSAGRYIVISPRQSAIVSSQLETINDWLQYGEEGGSLDEEE
jgi:hypothetical protein